MLIASDPCSCVFDIPLSFRSLVESHEMASNQLKSTLESQKSVLAVKEEEVEELKNQQEDLKGRLDIAEALVVEIREKASSLEEANRHKENELTEKGMVASKLNTEVEALRKGEGVRRTRYSYD